MSIANFKCNQCGDCCRSTDPQNGVLLFPTDIVKIARYLKLSEPQFLRSYCKKRIVRHTEWDLDLYLLKKKSGRCMFQLPNNLCSIHSHKPIQCKRTPFHFFWSEMADIKYQCILDMVVPSDWNTDRRDKILISSLIKHLRRE